MSCLLKPSFTFQMHQYKIPYSSFSFESSQKSHASMLQRVEAVVSLRGSNTSPAGSELELSSQQRTVGLSQRGVLWTSAERPFRSPKEQAFFIALCWQETIFSSGCGCIQKKTHYKILHTFYFDALIMYLADLK